MFVGIAPYALHLPTMIGLARCCLNLPESFAELIRLFDTRYRVKGQYFTRAVDVRNRHILLLDECKILCYFVNSVYCR
jgi:hypothetical protein